MKGKSKTTLFQFGREIQVALAHFQEYFPKYFWKFASAPFFSLPNGKSVVLFFPFIWKEKTRGAGAEVPTLVDRKT